MELVSHIPKFEDTGKSPASRAGDIVASPNFGICDTTDFMCPV
jgi:hypothetical protein